MHTLVLAKILLAQHDAVLRLCRHRLARLF